MSKPIDFKKMVSDMRQAQRAYYRTRSIDDLKKAKLLERDVDAFLEKYFRELSNPQTLFD